MIFEAIESFFARLLSYIVVFVTSEAFIWTLAAAAVAAFLLLLVKIYLVIRGRMLVNIVYRRSFSENGVYEGEETELVETIRNCSFFPLLKVDVEAYFYDGLSVGGVKAGSGGGMECMISRFNLWPFMQIRRRHTVNCLARGHYNLQVISIYRRKGALTLSAPAEIYVYPKVVPSDVLLYATGLVQGDYISPRPLFQDPFSFSGVRDYRIGDPISQINFKATARSSAFGGLSALRVNSRDFCASRRIMIYMDFHVPMGTGIDGVKYSALTERGLSLSAALVREAVYSGFRAGFAANCKGENGSLSLYFRCEGGEEHLKSILRAMAMVRPQDGVSFASLIDRAFEDGESSTEFVIICYALSEDTLARLKELERYGNSFRIIPMESFGSDLIDC